MKHDEPKTGLFTDHMPVLAPGRLPFARALEVMDSPEAKAIALEAWRVTMMEGKAMLPTMFLAEDPENKLDPDPLRHLNPEKYFSAPKARQIADACRYGMGHSVAEGRKVQKALRELVGAAIGPLREALLPFGSCSDIAGCEEALQGILDRRYGAGMRARLYKITEDNGRPFASILWVGANVAGLYEKAGAQCFTDPEKPMVRPENLRA